MARDRLRCLHLAAPVAALLPALSCAAAPVAGPGPSSAPAAEAAPPAASQAPAVPQQEAGAPAPSPALPAGPSLALEPARVRPGDLFAVTVQRSAAPPRGEVEGRPLRFYPVPGGFRALAALPVEARAGALRLQVTAAGPEGEAPLGAELEVIEPAFAEAELRVARRFITPSPQARRRMRRDQEAFRRAFDQPFEPPLFRQPFTWPRQGEVTSRFGDKRVFNGRKLSQHFGVDLAGAVGDPVDAANDGRVVLARDCYASGKSVVVWHGAGLSSVYFHLSHFAVREGEAVRRGERLGLVGRTGRVTGPHLHWGTKLGEMYVDPESVLRLRAGDGPAGAAAAGR